MGSLTRRQRLRLAREARILAMDSLRAQLHFNPHDWCRCAAGRIVKRSGIRDWVGAFAARIGCLGIPISEATYRYVRGERLALSFPLLALADVLEEAQP